MLSSGSYRMSPYTRTNHLLARIMQYAVITGLATSMLALACLIAVSKIWISNYLGSFEILT
ncbi:hypothetical protein BDQ17DRAFT_1350269 [Cyathus striatus]|nr:hypothetical protein BDQ17DRAFT_1350269 [Cyathus striatus]